MSISCCCIACARLSTLTTNVAGIAVLPALSVAVHVTIVSPIGNVEPDGGLQVGVIVPSTSSVAQLQIQRLKEHWSHKPNH
jgi:hypothetical protein